MKKLLLILIIAAGVAAIIGGLAVAGAQGNVDGDSNVKHCCDEWILGTVMGKTGSADSGVFEVLPRGQSETIDITTDEETVYKTSAYPWSDAGFDDIEYGDWIAVCMAESVARVVTLLDTPFHLNLNGNVTAVSGNTITVTTGSGGNYTIDLTNAGVDVTGVREGQPVRLSIGSAAPVFTRCFPRFHPGWFIGKCNAGATLGFKDTEGKLEQFRERIEFKFAPGIQERLQRIWQNRFAD